MLNRRHIRIKVLQALYMYYNDGRDKKDLALLEKSLEKSISKLYELYLYLLVFLEELGAYAIQYEDTVKGRYVTNAKEIRNSIMLYDNEVIQKLTKSEVFHKATKAYKVQWAGDEDLLRKIFFDLKNQEVYNDFIQFSGQNKILEQEILLHILKHYTSNYSLMTQHLEEQYYNWLDDKKIAVQMACRTIQMLATSDGKEEFLLPLSQNDDDNYEFASELMNKTISEDEKIEEILKSRISKWEPSQIAVIDLIILKMATCEFLNFPSIPAVVTINEYVELSKNYSTPQSKKFINGILDAVVKGLKQDGIMIKN